MLAVGEIAHAYLASSGRRRLWHDWSYAISAICPSPCISSSSPPRTQPRHTECRSDLHSPTRRIAQGRTRVSHRATRRDILPAQQAELNGASDEGLSGKLRPQVPEGEKGWAAGEWDLEYGRSLAG